MDCEKIGKLICGLRREKGMTQKQLADALHLSDRTISKWERGLGCPDVSLLRALSGVLGVRLEQLLQGDLAPNRADGGNMKRVKFYVCPACGNIICATGSLEAACCGRTLAPLDPRPCDAEHRLRVEPVEDELYITFPHAMQKDHFLRFVACVGWDRVLLVRLYPEQGGELRLPQLRGSRLYCCCSMHGLWINE